MEVVLTVLLQPDNWSCGAYAIVNACLALGHDHTSEIAQIAEWAGTTREKGTDERGILRALERLQYAVQVTDRVPLETLWTSLRNALDRGSPTVLCVDGVDHWVAVVGGIGFGSNGRLLIFDSQRDAANQGETSGLLIYDERQLKKRLGGSRYGVMISDLQDDRDSVGRDANFDVMTSVLELARGSGDVFAQRGEDKKISQRAEMPPDLARWLLGGRS